MGKGVNRRETADRSGKAARIAEGSEAVLAEEVDRGTDLLLVGPEQEDEQGLQAAARERRALIYAAMSRLMLRRLARS
jgi:hypothetical protein